MRAVDVSSGVSSRVRNEFFRYEVDGPGWAKGCGADGFIAAGSAQMIHEPKIPCGLLIIADECEDEQVKVHLDARDRYGNRICALDTITISEDLEEELCATTCGGDAKRRAYIYAGGVERQLVKQICAVTKETSKG